MGDRHTLGDTRGPRGVDDVGDIVGAGRRQRDAGLSVNNRIVDIDDHHLVPVQPRSQLGSGDRGDRGGIADHELDPAVGHRRIDRQVRRPRLEHPQNRDDCLSRARKQQRHRLTRAGALARSVTAPTGSRPDRPRDRSSSGPRQTDRHRLRGANHLCGKQCRNRHADDGLGQHRSIADLIQAHVFALHRAHRSTTPAAWDRPSWPPAPARTARSVSRCLPCRTRRSEIPPSRKYRPAHRPESSVRPAIRSGPTAQFGHPAAIW